MSGIKDLASKGRNGDNMLMHVSTGEVAGLNALAKNTMGRELTTNPDTGLPEAFMFAPFLAPLAAGGVGGALGIGGGALATGLTAGALGAAEAELRGMDDPLKRGLFAGLTAGAASGIGNQLSAAGEAGAAAPVVDGAANTSQAVMAPGASAGNMQSVPQMSIPGSGFTPQPTPTDAATGLGISSTAPSQVIPPAPSPTTGGGGFNPMNMFRDSQYADIPQMGQGAQNIATDQATRQQFMQNVRAPATAGFIGLGGQAQLNAQDEMKARAEASDRESAAELKEAQDRIRANYAAVGRPMPTGFGGGPLFADGGIVNLRRGGPARGARGRSMSSKSSSSSRGGGGGGSTHPGRPGGESGERSLTRGGGGGGGGGSSAAVQAPRQMDPAKIRSAVISPMDDFATGLGRLVSMSPTVRALQHLTRDRRGLGGSAPYGPGAPLTARERGEVPARREPGDNDRPMPAAAPSAPEPTLPLAPTAAPNPNFNPFLMQLQQGAGNRMAMQRTGYAQGGYLDGGMLPGDGMSDDVPATIDGDQPAALSSGEFVIPADVVSHIGNGSSDAGAKELYAMMDRIREARTGREEQAPAVNTKKMMPK